MKDELDIIIVSETKLDDSFPESQFQIDYYSTYRKDENDKGGGIPICIREYISS